MSRLFITQRELDFIADTAKELIKDVVGQKIYYYRVREDLTTTHEFYEESVEKIFDHPVELEARVKYQKQDIVTNKFGIDARRTIEVDIQYSDLIDKDIEVRMGDFFSYDTSFFEISTATSISVIYGQVEHINSMKVIGLQSRDGIISLYTHGPTDERLTDNDSVQKIFVLQRGFSENDAGVTNDSRRLKKKGKIETIAEAPVQVSPKADSENGIESSFYGEDA